MQQNIKGIVQEIMHTYRDTGIGPRLGRNPLWGKIVANLLLLRSSSNGATKESTMIHNFIYEAKK